MNVIVTADPSWLASIRRRMAEGETYEQWRTSFQRMISVIPGFDRTMAKSDAEPLLLAMWEISRAKAAEGSA